MHKLVIIKQIRTFCVARCTHAKEGGVCVEVV